MRMMFSCLASIFCISLPLFAVPTTKITGHFYIGGIAGFGSTTWNGLVPSEEHNSLAMAMSTPQEVQEGGGVYGAMLGYEIWPSLALEASFLHYPHAKIVFDADSLFSFYHGNETVFNSHTKTGSLTAKYMVGIPNKGLRLFANAGVALIHRNDLLLHSNRISPTFGIGANYPISSHWMAEVAGNYVAGYGESQINPADTYFPFLYSVTLRLAYFF